MLDQLTPSRLSPYRVFSAREWAKFRADTPLTLSEGEVRRLRSLGDPVDLEEVSRIYLSMSRLLYAHVEASQLLFRQRQTFLSGGAAGPKTPFIIGIAGSVAVGKSTTARILTELLGRWTTSPRVALVTTDGFLYPNAVLEAEGLMQRKGFPESYDVSAILRFLSDVKAGARHVQAPVYSHIVYDVVHGQRVTIDRPDILVFEGLNVLQVRDMPKDGKAVPFVSDFFDYSIYIDADEDDIRRWYIERFMKLRETAFRDERAFFHRYSKISDEEALAIAERLWTTINARNLHENILPTRPRADLILRKGRDHLVDQVALRKI
ncbi:type I pantothenate kinase [Aurantimonas sp. Leaf443]|uniref:type I pantothenate kinase n=1 Tax=Aurantimonas sp. Leaf443 TaxID=1736378 RepID=UPI0006FAB677|nr:type I pantothenate kinase [Aurantimonas sp. Leaf443]KQT85572.1 type I pantothenate kinase [Aurantimonas sp. Leaf443]